MGKRNLITLYLPAGVVGVNTLMQLEYDRRTPTTA